MNVYYITIDKQITYVNGSLLAYSVLFLLCALGNASTDILCYNGSVP